jgi:hypothetical protein
MEGPFIHHRCCDYSYLFFQDLPGLDKITLMCG